MKEIKWKSYRLQNIEHATCELMRIGKTNDIQFVSHAMAVSNSGHPMVTLIVGYTERAEAGGAAIHGFEHRKVS